VIRKAVKPNTARIYGMCTAGTIGYSTIPFLIAMCRDIARLLRPAADFFVLTAGNDGRNGNTELSKSFGVVMK